MKYIKDFIRFVKIAMAVVGAILVYLSISTVDYHVIELGENEPSQVWVMLAIGAIMTLPAMVSLFRHAFEE